MALAAMVLLPSIESRLCLAQNRTVFTLVSAFLLFMCASVFWSEDPSLVGKYLGYAILVFLFVQSLTLLNSKFPWFFKSFITLFCLAAAVSVAYSILLYHQIPYQTEFDARMYSLGGLHNPMIGGLSYGAALILGIAHCVNQTEKIKKLLMALVCLVIFVGVIYTGTRSAWVGVIFAVLTLIMFHPKLSLTKKKICLALFILAFIVALLTLFQLGLTDALTKRSLSFRPEIWSEVMANMNGSALFFGHGLASNAAVEHLQYVFDHPHSIYLSTLFYGGIIGLSLFLTLSFWVLKNLIQNIQNPSSIYALALLVFGLVSLLVDGNRLVRKIDFIWLLIWLPIALSFIRSPASAIDTVAHQKDPPID